MAKIKVLAIVGTSRCGSTLLEKILGEADNILSIGEIQHLWKDQTNFYCGCNRLFKDCPFWNAVYAEAFGRTHNIDKVELAKLRKRSGGFGFLPFLLIPRLRTRQYQERLSIYLEHLQKLYNALAKISNNSVILDASKSPSYFHELRVLPDIDLNVIHLVRDSRAVAYSLQKQRLMTYIPGNHRYMPRSGIFKSAMVWNVKNILASSFRNSSCTYTVVRYEQFAEHPRAIAQNILESIGADVSTLGYITDQGSKVTTNHAIYGNPSLRLRQGFIEIKKDMEWQEKLKTSKKAAITMLTWPLLIYYGYYHAKSVIRRSVIR